VSKLSIIDFGSQGIRFENRNGKVWVNLTDMAKASGKRFPDWNRLDSTTEFITALEGIVGFRTMVSNVGGSPETTGTWAIEEVAIKFAAWCSVSFEIWVCQQIKTLMNEGSVSLGFNRADLDELFRLQNANIAEQIAFAIKPQMERIETYDRVCKEHKGTGYVISSSVNDSGYPKEVVTTFEYCETKGLDRRLWKTFGKRYAQFVRVGTKEEPVKRRGKLLIFDDLYYYADCALKSIMDLD